MTDVRWTQLSADAARVQLKAATQAVELKATTAAVTLHACTSAVALMATTSAITIATAVYAQFIIISEAITGQFVDFRRLYDVAQTSDLMVRVMNYVRLFNDQVDTSDNTVLSYRKSLTDTATTSDAAAKRVATAKLDQISTADAKSFVAGKPLQDSATAEEYLVKVMNFARFFTDYITKTTRWLSKSRVKTFSPATRQSLRTSSSSLWSTSVTTRTLPRFQTQCLSSLASRLPRHSLFWTAFRGRWTSSAALWTQRPQAI